MNRGRRGRGTLAGADDFRLADRIRGEEKYFDISLQDVLIDLVTLGEVECTSEHYSGEDDPVVLRLNLHAKSEFPTSWTAALKLHHVRIDGIDYEPVFLTMDGTLASGWHRHHWDANTLNADRDKRQLASFGGGKFNIRTFVIRAASELCIRLNNGGS